MTLEGGRFVPLSKRGSGGRIEANGRWIVLTDLPPPRELPRGRGRCVDLTKPRHASFVTDKQAREWISEFRAGTRMVTTGKRRRLKREPGVTIVTGRRTEALYTAKARRAGNKLVLAFHPLALGAAKGVDDLIMPAFLGLAEAMAVFPVDGKVPFEAYAKNQVEWHVADAKDEWAKAGQGATRADVYWFRNSCRLLNECRSALRSETFFDLTSGQIDWLTERVAEGSGRSIKAARRAVERSPGGGHAVYDENFEGDARAEKANNALLAKASAGLSNRFRLEGAICSALEDRCLKALGIASTIAGRPYALERFASGAASCGVIRKRKRR
jgi:hypothetical protein